MEVDDNRKKKIWKKKTKQIKSRTENKDSVDQINTVDGANRSFFSKPPRGDLNQLCVNGNEAFIHGKNEEFWMEKQVEMEAAIADLQHQKDLLSQKEAEMEAVIADLQHQKDLLSQKEKNNMKSLERLHVDNTQLYLQVMELEKSQSYLLEENEKLLKKISIFQSQIQILERIISSNNFSTENIKVDESGVKTRSIDSDPSTHPTAHETQVLESSVRDSSTEEAPEHRNNGDMESEIAGGEVAEGGVPLSHAPLIGAPFRFISFVASYVSGADLVGIQQ